MARYHFGIRKQGERYHALVQKVVGNQRLIIWRTDEALATKEEAEQVRDLMRKTYKPVTFAGPQTLVKTYLSTGTVDALKADADRRGVSVSALIRTLCEEYLERLRFHPSPDRS